MTVAELIEKLQAFPPDQRVMVNDDHAFRNPTFNAETVHADGDDWWYTRHEDGDCVANCSEHGPVVTVLAL